MTALRIIRLTFVVTAIVMCSAAAGEELRAPVPRITIYPGDRIAETMIEEKTILLPPGSAALAVISQDALIGKIARRTLLPGQPIAANAIDNPRIVAVGAQVKIIFSEPGMQIVAYGIAQQPGAIGDVIRVRNQDSGLFVSGRVQPDGSIHVDEG
jgi:flagella basal body P-ring formation protein FlgA